MEKIALDATADQNIFGTNARHLHDVNKQHETRRGTTRTSRGRSRFKKQAFIVLLLSRVPGPPNRGVWRSAITTFRLATRADPVSPMLERKWIETSKSGWTATHIRFPRFSSSRSLATLTRDTRITTLWCDSSHQYSAMIC